MLRRGAFVLALFVAIAALIPTMAVAQGGDELSGVWFLEEVRVGDRVDSSPLPGMFFFSDGYVAFVDVQASSPRTFADPGDPTRAEKTAAYEGFGAVAGEYEVRDDTLFARAYVSLDPGQMQGWPENTRAIATVRVMGERASLDFIGNPMIVTFRRLDGTSLPR